MAVRAFVPKHGRQSVKKCIVHAVVADNFKIFYIL